MTLEATNDVIAQECNMMFLALVTKLRDAIVIGDLTSVETLSKAYQRIAIPKSAD